MAWLTSNNDCPICRAPFDAEDPSDEEDDEPDEDCCWVCPGCDMQNCANDSSVPVHFSRVRCSGCRVTRNTHRLIHNETSLFPKLYEKTEKVFKKVLAFRSQRKNAPSIESVRKSIKKFQQCRELWHMQRHGWPLEQHLVYTLLIHTTNIDNKLITHYCICTNKSIIHYSKVALLWAAVDQPTCPPVSVTYDINSAAVMLC